MLRRQSYVCNTHLTLDIQVPSCAKLQMIVKFYRLQEMISIATAQCFARLFVTSSLSLQLLNQMTAFVFLKSYGILLESYLCQHCYTDVRI